MGTANTISHFQHKLKCTLTLKLLYDIQGCPYPVNLSFTYCYHHYSISSRRIIIVVLSNNRVSKIITIKIQWILYHAITPTKNIRQNLQNPDHGLLRGTESSVQALPWAVSIRQYLWGYWQQRWSSLCLDYQRALVTVWDLQARGDIPETAETGTCIILIFFRKCQHKYIILRLYEK